MSQAVFRTPTAFCEHCLRTIEQAVSNLKGVSGVTVDLPRGQVAVVFDPLVLSASAVRDRIEGAGFPVVGVPEVADD